MFTLGVPSVVMGLKADAYVHARFTFGLLLGPSIKGGLAEVPLERLAAPDSPLQPTSDPGASPVSTVVFHNFPPLAFQLGQTNHFLMKSL